MAENPTPPAPPPIEEPPQALPAIAKDDFGASSGASPSSPSRPQTGPDADWMDKLVEQLGKFKNWVDFGGGMDPNLAFSFEVNTAVMTTGSEELTFALTMLGPKGSPWPEEKQYAARGDLTVVSTVGKHFEWELKAPLTCEGFPDMTIKGSSRKQLNHIVEIRLATSDPPNKMRFQVHGAGPDTEDPADKPEGKEDLGSRTVSGITAVSGSTNATKMRLKTQKSIKSLASFAGKANVEDMDNLEKAQNRLRNSFSALHLGAGAHGLTGEQQLALMTSKPPKIQGVQGLTQMRHREHTSGRGKKQPVSRDLLRIIVLEDEYQLMSCMSLPLTIFFFLVFMFFFQTYYNTPSLFMAESITRQSMCEEAYRVETKEDIMPWMRDYYFPYLWHMGEVDKPGETDAFQELIGGVMMALTESEKVQCTDSLGKSFKCYPEDPAQAKKMVDSTWEGIPNGYILTGRQLSGGLKVVKANEFTAASRRLQETPEGIASASLRKDRWASQRRKALFSHQCPPGARGGVCKTSASKVQPVFDQPAETPMYRVTENGVRWRNRTQRTPGYKIWKATREKAYLTGERDMDPELLAKARDRMRRRLSMTRPEFRSTMPDPETGVLVEKATYFFMPHSLTEDQWQASLARMQEEAVIGTEALFLSFHNMLYNGQVKWGKPGEGLATNVMVMFRFSRGGKIYAQCNLNTLVLNLTIYMTFIFVCWNCCLLLTTVMISLNAFRAWRHGHLSAHFKRFWNLLEWGLVVFGWFIVVCFIDEQMQTAVFKKDYAQYKETRSSESGKDLYRYDADSFAKLYDYFELTAQNGSWLQMYVAFFHIVLLLRYVVASRGQPKLSIVVKTIRLAAVDLLHLIMVFGIIFAAYVLSGHILFGRRMEEFATLQGAVAECIYIILAREYEWHRFIEQDFFTVTLWVWSFLIVVVLVLVNIMLAMIFDAHGEIRNAVSEKDTLGNTIAHFLTHLKLLSTWVSNPDLIRWLLDVGEDQISADMLKDQWPMMNNKQLNHIFDMAKTRHELLVVRGNNNALPETIASVLIGVDQMRGAVRVMKTDGMVKRHREKKPLGHGGSTDSLVSVEPTDAPKFPEVGKDPARQTSAASQSDMEDSFLMLPPAEPPRWLKVGVLESLKKQSHKLGKVHEKLEQQEQLARNRFGVGRPEADPLPVPKPMGNAMQRQRNGDKALPVAGTQGGRKNLVVKAPPATRGPPSVQRVKAEPTIVTGVLN